MPKVLITIGLISALAGGCASKAPVVPATARACPDQLPHRPALAPVSASAARSIIAQDGGRTWRTLVRREQQIAAWGEDWAAIGRALCGKGGK